MANCNKGWLTTARVGVVGLLAAGAQFASAQTCAGGAYLNPKSIRGDAVTASAQADMELQTVIAKTPLPAAPFWAVKTLAEIKALTDSPTPPCWIFGNPPAGLYPEYRPTAVNTTGIEPAILFFGAVGQKDAAAPVLLSALAPAEQKQVKDALRASKCLGMDSGVTSEIARAEGICGSISLVRPRAGIGQAFLPAAAAMEWSSSRPVGVVTRKASAMRASASGLVSKDPLIAKARLIVVPLSATSWGYGLYTHPSVGAQVREKSLSVFQAIKAPTPTLSGALDLSGAFEFVAPGAEEERQMRAAMGPATGMQAKR